MKKIFIILQFVFLLGIFSGCQREEIKEVKTLAIEPQLFQYKGTEEVNTIAVNEEGFLYTITCIEPEDLKEPNTQRFQIYDLDGKCIEQKDIVLGNSILHTTTLEGTTLYCTVFQRGKGLSVNTIDVTTWEVTEVALLEEDFTMIDKIIPIGDYIYLLGISSVAGEKGYSLHPTVEDFYYAGEMIGRISRTDENSQIQFFNIDFPIDMYKTKEDNLMIYHVTKSKNKLS